jgi:hypothetical protein
VLGSQFGGADRQRLDDRRVDARREMVAVLFGRPDRDHEGGRRRGRSQLVASQRVEPDRCRRGELVAHGASAREE